MELSGGSCGSFSKSKSIGMNCVQIAFYFATLSVVIDYQPSAGSPSEIGSNFPCIIASSSSSVSSSPT